MAAVIIKLLLNYILSASHLPVLSAMGLWVELIPKHIKQQTSHSTPHLHGTQLSSYMKESLPEGKLNKGLMTDKPPFPLI